MRVEAPRRFILIDHSVAGEGGHYLEYARHVLDAARSTGYEPILATNRAFREPAGMGFAVHPVYERDVWGRRFARPWRRRRAPKALNAWARIVLATLVRLRYSRAGLIMQLAGRPQDSVLRFPDVRSIALLAAVGFVFLYLRAIFRAVRDLLTAVMRPIVLGYPGDVSRALLHVLQSFIYPIRAPWRHRSLFLRAWRHQRSVTAFARDTRALLRELQPRAADLVFIPTLSEADLSGLIRCFRAEPVSREPSWHLLFRRDIYSGREHAYGASRDEAERIRRSLLRESLIDLVINLASHQVRVYTDTDRLTDQYNRLNTFEFATLPIPVNRAFRPHAQVRQPPLKVTYLGDARSEKGYHLLPQIVDAMQPELEAGLVRFAFQSNFAFSEPEADAAVVVARTQLRVHRHERAQLYERALTTDQYAELLTSSDLLLIPYDPDRYYARSSGVLVEALSAGIPVIVPAGSWMSDVLQAETTRYHESLALSCANVRTMPSLRWRSVSGAPLDKKRGAVFGGGRAGMTTRFSLASTDRYLLVRLVPAAHLPPGTYLRIWARFVARDSAAAGTSVRIVRATRSERATALIEVPHGSERVELILSNAWDSSLVVLLALEVDALGGHAQRGLEALGRTYERAREIPHAVREVVTNYAAYRERANSFALRWLERHTPELLVSKLIAAGSRSAQPVIETARTEMVS